MLSWQVDKMYEALCSSSVFADPKSQSTPFIREHAIKQVLRTPNPSILPLSSSSY